MLPRSRSISLAIGAALLGLAVYFLIHGIAALPLVKDDAGLMSETQRQRVAEYHAYLLADHDIDYRVVTARGLDDINREAVALFERISADGRSETGRGLLLVIDADAVGQISRRHEVACVRRRTDGMRDVPATLLCCLGVG